MQKDKTISRSLTRKTTIMAGIIVVTITLLSAASYKLFVARGKSPAEEMLTFVVKRGPLRINVIESGTIKAREQVIIKSQVEGRTTILSLVPEGTLVKNGDLLVQLDASKLLDDKIDQEIRVQNADAAFVWARENLAVAKNQAESDIDRAELTLEFARLDLKKYLEGDYPNQLTARKSEITLRKEEKQRAEENLNWSNTLFKEKYISQTELQADQLAATRAELDLKRAQNDLDLLITFTYKRNLAQLESDVKQAGMALERTNRKAKADVVQAEADLRAKQSEFKRQQDKLEKINDQIKKTKIYAPADGLVIYATSAKASWRGNAEPLDEGQDVRERQELIYLPTATSAKAEVDIHEANLEKVRLGLPAIITVDALLGKKFSGTVANIAPLPDAQSMWMNPDLKVYNTDIYLDSNDSSLRTGMSCQAEIIIEQYDNALYVPVHAVLRVEGETTVYVANGKTIEPRKVKIGLDNNIMVRIISGLEEGEAVSLTPPLKSAVVGQATNVVTETTSAGKKAVADEPQRQAVTQKPLEGDEATETKEKMRKRFEDMSAEERQKMRQRFQNMSPEEREKMRRQRRGGGSKQPTRDE